MPAAITVSASATAINGRVRLAVGAAATSRNPGWLLIGSAPGTDSGGWLDLLCVPGVGLVRDAGIESTLRGDAGTDVAGHAVADARAAVRGAGGVADEIGRVDAQLPGARCRWRPGWLWWDNARLGRAVQGTSARSAPAPEPGSATRHASPAAAHRAPMSRPVARLRCDIARGSPVSLAHAVKSSYRSRLSDPGRLPLMLAEQASVRRSPRATPLHALPLDRASATGAVRRWSAMATCSPRDRSRNAATLDVQPGADPADLRLGDAAVRAEGFDQVVDRAGTGAVQIRLHDHREQRLIRPPPAFEQAREERPDARLRNLQLHMPARRGTAQPTTTSGDDLSLWCRSCARRSDLLGLHRSACTGCPAHPADPQRHCL
jgi:hypothetical protein